MTNAYAHVDVSAPTQATWHDSSESAAAVADVLPPMRGQFIAQTDVQDARATQYDTIAKTGAESSASAAELRHDGPAERTVASVAAANAFGTIQRQVHSFADRLVSPPDDPIEKQLLVEELDDALLDLWEYRDQRGPDWAGLMSIIRAVIGTHDFEQRPASQFKALAEAARTCARGATVTTRDLQTCIQTLTEADFDVWAAASE